MNLTDKIYRLTQQSRKRIIETMRERNIAELATCMSYAEWCKENKLEPEEDETDDTEYLDYKDQESPYCVFIHKYDMNEYRIDKVTLEGDRFKFEGYCDELGYDWQWEDDTVWATRIFVWERLAEILGIDDEPEKVWVMTQESNVDGEIHFCVTVCKDKETAIEKKESEKEWIRNESIHFKDYDPNDEDLNVEDFEEKFFIGDLTDDYYEEIVIEECAII